MSVIRILSSFLILTCLVSCSVSKKLASNLNQKRHSLAYVFDSDFRKEKTNIAVKVDSVAYKPSTMPDLTEVTKKKGVFLPLLLLNVWDYQYSCNLGENVIEENLPDFFYDSLIMEAYRSGNFLVNPQDSIPTEKDTPYELEISIDSLAVQGPYTYTGFTFIHPFGYVYSFAEIAGPATAVCKIEARLLKNGEIKLIENIRREEISVFLSNKAYTVSKELQMKYSVAMTEALSLSIKNSLSELVDRINIYMLDNEEEASSTLILADNSEEKTIENILVKEKEVEIKIPDDYLIFTLTDGRQIKGILKQVKKKNIYVEDGKTLYTINKKLLSSINDVNQENITESQLARKDFGKIDYNYYLTFIEIK